MVVGRQWRRRLRLVPVPPPRSFAAFRLPALLAHHQVALSFLLLVALGTGLLLLPASTPAGQAIDFVDALFTATSAACVTGLTVRDTGTGFTPFGQGVILALVQLGGLGIMTLSLLVFTLGGRLSIGQLSLVEQTFAAPGSPDLRELVRLVFLSTLSIEATGTAVLFMRWQETLGPAKALWFGCFHAVSAFCNAGFSLFPDNLVSWRRDWTVNLVVIALIVLGGIGFLVLHDLRRTGLRLRGLGLHARLALATTGLLLAFGTLALWAIEGRGSFAAMAPVERFQAALFQSVTARTAGFNTVDFATLAPASLLLVILLMFVGGSPGSCAGGIKTTTAAVLLLTTRARLGGRQHVNVFHRTLPARLVQTAFALTSLAFAAAALGLFTLLLLEGAAVGNGDLSPLDLAFETVSALGTVGLSTGITSRLSEGARLVLSLLMFVGRVGPLTLAAIFVGDERPDDLRHPEEQTMVG